MITISEKSIRFLGSFHSLLEMGIGQILLRMERVVRLNSLILEKLLLMLMVRYFMYLIDNAFVKLLSMKMEMLRLLLLRVTEIGVIKMVTVHLLDLLMFRI